MTFAVTLVRIAAGCPIFEIGAYRYTGTWLPAAGDFITITRAPDVQTQGPHERQVFVTRVDPTLEIPIRVTEPTGLTVSPPDADVVVA
jgi:hypothetical protein